MKLALKDKLEKIKMEKGDTIPKYLTKFTQCWYEFGSVGVTTTKDDLVSLALLGLTKRTYVPSNFYFEGKLVQEEILWNARDGSSSKHDDEENYALVAKAAKEKGKSSHSKSYYIQGANKDLSKIKGFHCHELGCYATNFLHKKANLTGTSV